MLEDPAARVPSAQTGKARPQQDVRRTNLTDPRPKGAILAHSADPTLANEASPVYGATILVLGYERVTLLLAFTQGAATAFNVTAQVAGQDEEWHDLYADETGDGTLARKVWVTTVAASGRRAFVIPAAGAKMRFNVFADGANGATNHTLYAVRHMDAS